MRQWLVYSTGLEMGLTREPSCFWRTGDIPQNMERSWLLSCVVGVGGPLKQRWTMALRTGLQLESCYTVPVGQHVRAHGQDQRTFATIPEGGGSG